MANSIRRTAGVTATAAAVALGLAACGAAQEAEGDGEGNLLEQLQEQGSITVAFAGEIPYSWETEDGELTGATIALDREIYSAMGIDNVEGQYVDWDALIPGLNKGEYDSVSAGMSILPDRCAQASFSDPALMYTTGLMVPEGNPMGLSDLQSVIDSDAQLAVQSGTIEQGYADDLGIANPEVVQSSQDGMAAVSSGRVDAFALTAISLRSMAEDNPDSAVEVTDAFVAEIDGVPQVSAGATVFRDADTDLLEAYNEQLDAIVSDPERFEEVVGEFGFTEAERPADGLTTEMFCEGTDEDLQEAAEIQENK